VENDKLPFQLRRAERGGCGTWNTIEGQQPRQSGLRSVDPSREAPKVEELNAKLNRTISIWTMEHWLILSKT